MYILDKLRGFNIPKKDLPIFLIFITYLIYSFSWKYYRWTCLTPSMDYHSYLQMMWNSRNGNWLEYNGLKKDVQMMFQYHFAVILIPLAFFYFLVPHELTLYFVSTCFIASSVFPLYFLAKHFLRSSIASYLIVLIFLFYPPFLNVDLEGFAEELFSVPFVLFSLYFLIKNKMKFFSVFNLLTLSLRINMTAVVFSLGFLSLFFKKYKIGLATMIVSVLWLSLIIFVVPKAYPTPPPPKHPEKNAQYVWGFFSAYGKTPKEIITTVVTRPNLVVEKIMVKEKGIYFLDLYKPLFFLPLLSPYTYFALPIFMQNILTTEGRLFAVYNYYQASMLPFMFLGLIHTISWTSKNIAKLKKNNYINVKHLELFAAGSIFIYLVFVYDPTALPARRIPYNYYYNQTFMSKSHRDLEHAKITDQIPENFSIAIEEKLMEHLAERKFYYTSNYYADFKVDLLLTDIFETKEAVLKAKIDPNYTKIFDHYYLTLFVRNDLIQKKQISEELNLDESKNYIIYLPSQGQTYYTNSGDLTNESTSLYYKNDIAQPFVALEEDLNSLNFIAQRIYSPKGNLIVEIRTNEKDNPGELLFTKTIVLNSLSMETDTIKVDTNLTSLVKNQKYWLIIKLDTKNTDHDRLDIMKAKHQDESPLDLAMTKLNADNQWSENWSNNAYRLESVFYFGKISENNYENLDFLKTADGSLLASGTKKQLLEKMAVLQSLNQTDFKEVIIISK